VLLGRNDRCYQAFRAGEAAWGLQFHAEVTPRALHAWIASPRTGVDGGIDRAALRVQTDGRIGRWNELGKTTCRRFLAFAEGRGSTAGAATTRATSPRS
jgi:GMP synthase (glutamine-hydrolysing)